MPRRDHFVDVGKMVDIGFGIQGQAFKDRNSVKKWFGEERTGTYALRWC